MFPKNALALVYHSRDLKRNTFFYYYSWNAEKANFCRKANKRVTKCCSTLKLQFLHFQVMHASKYISGNLNQIFFKKYFYPRYQFALLKGMHRLKTGDFYKENPLFWQENLLHLYTKKGRQRFLFSLQRILPDYRFKLTPREINILNYLINHKYFYFFLCTQNNVRHVITFWSEHLPERINFPT